MAVAGPIAVGMFDAPRALAQQAETTARPSFEVASVKLNKSGVREGSRINFYEGQRFTANDYMPGALIMSAYDLGLQQLSGPNGPLFEDRYDIDAKPDHPVSPTLMKRMLQSLLEERFKLRLRREIRQVPVYALVVGKDGPKFHESSRGPNDGPVADFSSGKPLLKNSAMSDLVMSLSPRVPDRIVVDRTGLKGRYDLEYGWYLALRDPDAPSIFTAIQVLGLKLEPQKSPVEFFVVDHVERPSEN
jgi:uncharacterized protein (TIGR03435 family)